MLFNINERCMQNWHYYMSYLKSIVNRLYMNAFWLKYKSQSCPCMPVKEPSGWIVQVSEPDWPPELPQYDFFKHQIFFCRGTELSQEQAKAAWHIISQQHRERSISFCNMCLFWSYLFHNCSPGFCLCCQTEATRKQLTKSVSTHHWSHGR